MQENKISQNDKRNELMAHYKKINIFGFSNVGKSSLILSIEKFLENDFKIEQKEENNKQIIIVSNESGEEVEKKDNTPQYITEQIKRINLSYNETTELYLSLYETNIDKFDFIKEHIETLITYSECLIFMIDITNMNSFNSVTKLLPIISEFNKDKNKYFPPMILISNKTDLDNSREVSGFEIKEFIDQYPGMQSIELSLLEKDSFKEFMQKFVDIIKKDEQKDFYDHIHLVKIQDPPIIPKSKENTDNLEELSLNLFLLGSSTVGKTSFIKKFLKFDFFENSLSTLGIDVEKTLAKVGENFVKIELWDTAGQERLRSIPKRYYSKGDGFLLLFDVTNKSTYTDVTGWIKDIREARGVSNVNGVNDKKSSSNEVLFLIGNKIDETKKRVVNKEEARKLAESYGVSYFEISCKDGVNVYEILSKLIFEAFSVAKGNSQNFKLNNNKKGQESKKKACCN